DINKRTNRSTPRGVIAQNLVAHLKSRAIALAQQGSEPAPPALPQTVSRTKVDKSVLAIPELKRVRSKEHLRFVAGQPCLMRSHPRPCASRSLRSTAGSCAESERRIYRPSMHHPPQRKSYNR